MNIYDLPLVSVAIIKYNQVFFLRECIESILVQDYPNIEIVVADDGSNDGTHELLLKYSEKFPNKFVLKLSKINQGITKNSNLAHFACKGKYIAWMGGDDLMLPFKISKQVSYLELNSDCNIVYHNLDVFDSDTNNTLWYYNDKFKINGTVRESIKFGTFNGACSNMVRRSCTPENGFDVRLAIASDYLYWVETLINGGKIHYLDEVLGRYRRHSNNVVSLNKPDSYLGHLDHINSCNIIMFKYPKYRKEALFSLSRNYRSSRLYYNKKYYLFFLGLSFKTRLNFKSIVGYIIFLFSLSKVKK